MTDQTAVDRIPIARSVVYAVRGLPEIADEYNATRTIAPTEISLTYRAAEDSQLGRVHAYVSGWWMQDGQRVPMDKPVGRHFWGRTFADWPEWLAGEARLYDPDAAPAPAGQAPATDRAACPDPIECGYEAALGQAREETRRLGLMVDEYGAGASALTDKLRRARERHRETCILARGEVKPTAFRCGLCEVLDAPAAPLRRMAVEAQQPSLAVEDCTCIPFTRQNGVQRYCQPGDTVDMISGWEIGGDCPHHRDAVKAQQPARHIPCPDAFWLRRPEAPHDWQQRPDTQPVHCPGVPAAQQPKEARS